jgi:hypothetical protein
VREGRPHKPNLLLVEPLVVFDDLLVLGLGDRLLTLRSTLIVELGLDLLQLL